MNTRVPSFAFAQRAIQFSALHSSSVLNYQEQISSGLRFQQSSDEPIAFRQVASMKSRLSELEADRSSINRSSSVLNASVVQIQDVIDIVNRAKTLTQQGIQSLDDDERNSLAIEVDGLLDRMKQIGLSTFRGKYLYSGTKSETPPFEFSQPGGNDGQLEVTYVGSSQRSRANVGDSIAVNTYYSGLDLFGDSGRGDTFLVSHSGAKTGTGTDTLTGQATLAVTHTATNYVGGSGVQAGASSPDGDTILGPLGEHTLTIVDSAGDGSAGTVSLNGTDPVPFTSADTNLEVRGSGGHLVFVDMSRITAGFNGEVAIESLGTLSVDNGASTTAIDFSANQTVVNSASNGSVTIDASSIRQVGNDHLEFTGTSNAFQILHELSSDLRNQRGLDAQGVARSLDRRLGQLDGIASNAFAILGEQSTSLQTLEAIGARVDDLRLSTETQISEVQATDLPEAVLRLENSQALLQYTYAVTADLTSLSLLDFLR